MDVKCHQDWRNAKRSFTSLWEGKPAKSPYIGMSVPKPQALQRPCPPPPEDDEALWLDPEWHAAAIPVSVGNRYWIGATAPGELLLAGWLNSLGGTPRFDRHTIWFDTVPDIDFGKPSPFRHNPENPWFLKLERLFDAVAVSSAENGFCFSPSLGLPANDLLSMHMGTEGFLLALIDHPEWMRAAIIDGANDLLAVKRAFIEKAEACNGDLCHSGTGWMPIWAPEPFLRTQSDVSCMLSPDMFEKFVLPELEIYGKSYPLWYHLDGGNAKQHLPILLSLPYLRFIQYVPTPSEPANGIDHIEFYRQVQDAGKVVHIEIAAGRVTQQLVKGLDPARTLLCVNGVNSLSEAEDILSNVEKWSVG